MSVSLEEAFQALRNERDSLKVTYNSPDTKLTDVIYVISDMGHLMYMNSNKEYITDSPLTKIIRQDINASYETVEDLHVTIAVYSTKFPEPTKQYEYNGKTYTVDFTGI